MKIVAGFSLVLMANAIPIESDETAAITAAPVCEDKFDCSFFSGVCDTAEDMKFNCRKTCNFCDEEIAPAPTSECKDLLPEFCVESRKDLCFDVTFRTTCQVLCDSCDSSTEDAAELSKAIARNNWLTSQEDNVIKAASEQLCTDIAHESVCGAMFERDPTCGDSRLRVLCLKTCGQCESYMEDVMRPLLPSVTPATAENPVVEIEAETETAAVPVVTEAVEPVETVEPIDNSVVIDTEVDTTVVDPPVPDVKDVPSIEDESPKGGSFVRTGEASSSSAVACSVFAVLISLVL